MTDLTKLDFNGFVGLLEAAELPETQAGTSPLAPIYVALWHGFAEHLKRMAYLLQYPKAAGFNAAIHAETKLTYAQIHRLYVDKAEKFGMTDAVPVIPQDYRLVKFETEDEKATDTSQSTSTSKSISNTTSTSTGSTSASSLSTSKTTAKSSSSTEKSSTTNG